MKVLQTSIAVLFVLTAISLSGTVYFYSQIDREQNARIQAEKEKTDLERVIQEKEKIAEEKTQNAASLETQVGELKAEIRTKNQELTKNRTALAKLESEAKDLKEKNILLDKENKNLSFRLQHYEPVSNPGDSSAAAENPKPAKTGKVILVNRDYRFVVMGIGKLDGLELKDEVEIHRGSEVIGKVAVSKLYDSIASCDIVSEEKMPIQEGDMGKVLAR